MMGKLKENWQAITLILAIGGGFIGGYNWVLAQVDKKVKTKTEQVAEDSKQAKESARKALEQSKSNGGKLDMLIRLMERKQ